jgi:hypothetical protein
MRRVMLLLVLALARAGGLPAQTPLSARSALDILGFEARRAAELLDLRRRETALSRTDVYHGVWLREGGASDSVVFDLLPFASAPRAADGVALAFDPGLGPRMWAGATDLDPLRSALQGSAARLLLGAWRTVSPGPDPPVHAPRSCPSPRLRLGAEMVHGFGTDGRDAPPDTRELIVYADCERTLGRDWRVSAGLRGYAWRTPGRADRQNLESTVRLARAPPGNALVVFLDLSWSPQYHRGVLHLERPFDLSRFRLRPFLRLASGERLPFGLGFWPGGVDGFPGLSSGEGRGNREVTLAMDASHPVAGPLSFRALVAAGRTAGGGALLDGSGWLAGARAGLNLTTRFGLLRLEYGVATGGHRAIFVRVGNIW